MSARLRYAAVTVLLATIRVVGVLTVVVVVVGACAACGLGFDAARGWQ